MKIYRLRPVIDDRGNLAHRSLDPVHVDAVARHLFNGTPKADVWTADDAAVTDAAGVPRPRANFPYCRGGALVADARALSELYPILAEAGELLPVRSPDGTQYTLVNLVPLFDCVDTERSELRRLPSGTVAAVRRYVFVPRNVPARSLFKTTVRAGEIFATEGHLAPASEFKVQVDRLGLTGLDFREVWNDDGDPVDPIEPFDGVNIYQKK